MKDNAFIRGDNPMTKMEIRSTIIDYLELQNAKRVLEIGAGTGSVTVQMAKQYQDIHIDAIEMTESGISLIKENIEKHKVQNISLIHAKAPYEELKPCIYDAVYIGGSGRNLKDIMKWLESSYIGAGTRIVFSIITLETLTEALDYINQCSKYTNLEGSLLQVSRLDTLGKYHYFAPLNPCYIIKCNYGG